MLEKIIEELELASYEDDYDGMYEIEKVISLDDAIEIVTRVLSGVEEYE